MSSSHLILLLNAYPRSSITILFISEEDNFWIEKDVNELNSFTGDIRVYYKKENLRKIAPLTFLSIIELAISSRKFTEYFFPAISITANLLKQIIKDLNPDLIWCEHFFCSLLVSNSYSGKTPLIYSHHDFISRILIKREFKIKQLFRSAVIFLFETKNLKRINSVVIGSDTEEKRIKNISRLPFIIKVPIIYPTLQKDYLDKPMNKMPRIIHLGTSKATANILGLKDFILKTLPYLKQRNCICEILIIGIAKEEFEDKILAVPLNAHITFTGYVKDLTQYIQPYDIQIIPYKGTTGARTRLYNAVRFKNAVVCFSQSIGNLYPLVNGTDIYALNDFNTFNQTLVELCNDFHKRKACADSSYNKLKEMMGYGNYGLQLRRELSVFVND
jgi:glycosyltransferase involved in cell wall biosynthesis